MNNLVNIGSIRDVEVYAPKELAWYDDFVDWGVSMLERTLKRPMIVWNEFFYVDFGTVDAVTLHRVNEKKYVFEIV